MIFLYLFIFSISAFIMYLIAEALLTNFFKKHESWYEYQMSKFGIRCEFEINFDLINSITFKVQPRNSNISKQMKLRTVYALYVLHQIVTGKMTLAEFNELVEKNQPSTVPRIYRNLK